MRGSQNGPPYYITIPRQVNIRPLIWDCIGSEVWRTSGSPLPYPYRIVLDLKVGYQCCGTPDPIKAFATLEAAQEHWQKQFERTLVQWMYE